MKKLKKYCFWFGTYKKQFVICDPNLHNSVPVNCILFKILKLFITGQFQCSQSQLQNYKITMLGSIKVKFGHICNLWQLFPTCFQIHCEDLKLVSFLFMILIKWQYNVIWWFLLDDVCYMFDFYSLYLQKSKKSKTHNNWFLINYNSLLN